MLNELRTFFDHSRHTLWVRNVDASLDVLAFHGEERLSQPFTYSVEFTCTQHDLAAEQFLGRDARFSLHGVPQKPVQTNATAQRPASPQCLQPRLGTLYADGALLKQGVLDDTGQLLIDHQVVTRGYRLEMANGVNYQIPLPTDYRNAEQAHLANRGLHNHPSQTDAEVSQPTAHTDHRALYEAVLEGLSDKEEKNQ